MNNYDAALAQLHAAGLVVDHLVVDGSRQRCLVEGMDREKRGWYYLREWRAADGECYIVGDYGVWQGNDPCARKIQFSGPPISAAEKAAMRARMVEDRKREKAARQREAAAAARRAEAVWRKLPTSPPGGKTPEYLVRKDVQSYGLRYTASGAVVVPLQDERGGIHGLQFILPKDHPRRIKIKRDKDYWPAGLVKQGRYFMIGGPRHGGILLVAEGYATAATLHTATGLPVAVAFDAGNLRHVAAELKKAYRTDRILICADDDFLQRCRNCHQPTRVEAKLCGYCNEEHRQTNAGVREAETAALQVGGAVAIPAFPHDRGRNKQTDFNDLQHAPGGGLHLVRQQLLDRLDALGWQPAGVSVGLPPAEGGGDGAMPSRLSIEEAVQRYWGTYGFGGEVLFDEAERRLVSKKDVVNLLPRHGWDTLRDHPAWRVARDTEIGFDPTGTDTAIRCNMFGGWPTEPAPGKCNVLLDLLLYLCSGESNRDELYHWLLKWLAYPLQHPGAKMHSAIIVHGPQGTGKSRFFEAYARIYGPYGRVLGQEALEDKFNADWAEKKLFILADEVLARQDMFHVKNRLKGFITGETIRVNPKNIAAHNEKNHMNIVFLSNERMPGVLENDDRRHCVLWSPPKLEERFFADLTAEIDNGGIAALHKVLLDMPLGDFRPWTHPPDSSAKSQLQELSRSSEEQFVREWAALEIEGPDGDPLPFCPCLGSHLYRAYDRWCDARGERRRAAKELISLIGKMHGWRAGASTPTYERVNSKTTKNRKMVVPSPAAIEESVSRCRTGQQAELVRDRFSTQAEWLTHCFFAFERAIEDGL